MYVLYGRLDQGPPESILSFINFDTYFGHLDPGFNLASLNLGGDRCLTLLSSTPEGT